MLCCAWLYITVLWSTRLECWNVYGYENVTFKTSLGIDSSDAISLTSWTIGKATERSRIDYYSDLSFLHFFQSLWFGFWYIIADANYTLAHLEGNAITIGVKLYFQNDDFTLTSLISAGVPILQQWRWWVVVVNQSWYGIVGIKSTHRNHTDTTTRGTYIAIGWQCC